MCRFFFLRDPSLFAEWANLAMTGYRKECQKGILSAGLVEIDGKKMVRQRSIPPLECLATHFTLASTAQFLFYHIRIPFDRKKDSVVLENIHPFLLAGGRFVAMHNGLIQFRNPPSQLSSDSRHFFHLWMTYYNKLQDLSQAFQQAKQATLPSSSMNILLYDTVEKKLYLHRSTISDKLVPPMWISPQGVSNFRVPLGKTIPKGKLLVFPAVT